MSFTNLCLSVLALGPELSASLIGGLVAAVPVLANHTTKQAREATLIREMNALHPRDLEEAMLASQLLAALHGAEACFAAAEPLDPASKEASRLRRDGLAMQRSVIALQRAYHKSQARPMQEDAAGGEPRPTVPVKPATPPRGKAAEKEIPRTAMGQAAADHADAPVAAGAPAKFDPYADDPSLARLSQNWDKLKRWDDMTMEERREAFGYGAKTARGSNGNGAAAIGPGATEASPTAS